jgi:hypothetical protein
MRHFDAGGGFGLSFDFPRAWPEVHYVEESEFTSAIVFLSNAPLHDPCTRTFSSSGQGTICGYPVKTLPPGDVFVSWSDIRIPRRKIQKPNRTISDSRLR